MNDINTILFIGKPGSGKGTQAKLLSEKTGWSVHSSGDMFRAIKKEESIVGEKVRETDEKGLLQPDWFAAYLFQKLMFSFDPTAGIIFDGFGRKVPEAKIVLEVLQWLGRPMRAVHLKVSDENIIERLEKRKETSGRADDHVISKRLEEYRLYTDPSIEVFREAGVLIEIDGNGTVEDIQKEIRERANIQ